MNAKNPKLAQLNLLIEKYVPNESYKFIYRDLVVVTRESRLHKKEPQFYPPAIILLGQGSKSCYVGDQAFAYGAGDILVTMLPIPVETVVTEASEDKPLLAAGVGIDFARIANVLMKIENADQNAFQPIQANPSTS